MGIHGRDAAWRRALCASLASPGAAPAPAAQGSVMAFVLEADARGFQFRAFGTRRPWANGARALVQGEGTGPLRSHGNPFGLKTGLELRICDTPGVGANPIKG